MKSKKMEKYSKKNFSKKYQNNYQFLPEVSLQKKIDLLNG
jgi:hypothetical protein